MNAAVKNALVKSVDFMSPFILTPVYSVLIFQISRNNHYAQMIWVVGTLYGVAYTWHWHFSRYTISFTNHFVDAIAICIFPVFFWPLQVIGALLSNSVLNIIVRRPTGYCEYPTHDGDDVEIWLANNCPATVWSRPVLGYERVYFFREKDQMLFVLSGYGKLP